MACVDSPKRRGATIAKDGGRISGQWESRADRFLARGLSAGSRRLQHAHDQAQSGNEQCCGHQPLNAGHGHLLQVLAASERAQKG